MFPFILKPVYALVLLCAPSDRAPMFCLSLCPLPTKASPIEEALRLQVQHGPVVLKGFFFFGLDEDLSWPYVFGYICSVLLHRTPELLRETQPDMTQ